MGDLPHLLSSQDSKEHTKLFTFSEKVIGIKIFIRKELYMKQYNIYIYIYNQVRSARKVTSFTQNDCGQRYIMNIIAIFTNKIRMRYLPSFQKNIRSIPQPQYLSIRMFWLK